MLGEEAGAEVDAQRLYKEAALQLDHPPNQAVRVLEIQPQAGGTGVGKGRGRGIP